MVERGFRPYLALLLNAAVWGMSWWPLRQMQQAGLHPLWASSMTYLLGASVLLCVQPGLWSEYRRHPALWVLSLAAGSTMVGFNWGVAIGEVIRVVLLFYLMPVWAVLIARVVLKEPISPAALVRVAIALAGAVLILSPPGHLGMPVPSGLAEWLGLMGGAAFALNNVMLKQQEARSAQGRLFGMFVGGIVAPATVAFLLTLSLGSGNVVVGYPHWPGVWGVAVLLVFSVLLLLANYGLQYGASRLPANVTAVVMLSEVVFATLSAIALTDERLTLQVGMGGLLIFTAAVLSALHGAKAPLEGH